MEKQRILIVDDEKDILDLLEIFLTNDGYEVIKSTTGLDALYVLDSERIDLVVLDVMMPSMDGIQTCVRIRQRWNVPVLMLSAKGEDVDKILGLSTGADDYMAKPFNPLELLARVKSQLRRSSLLNLNAKSEPPSDSSIAIGSLYIDSAKHEVTVSGQPVRLTPREFDILELLARNQGVVLSMTDIYERVWNEPFYESANTVMVHIRKIREKIEVDPRKPGFIKTVWGVGYKIEQ